jgi:hypothetical protein
MSQQIHTYVCVCLYVSMCMCLYLNVRARKNRHALKFFFQKLIAFHYLFILPQNYACKCLVDKHENWARPK